MKNLTIEMISLLAESAIEEMSRINSASIEMVKHAIDTGNEIACSQFQKLMQVGIKELEGVS